MPHSLSLFSASPGLLRPTTPVFPLTLTSTAMGTERLAAVLSSKTRADSVLYLSQAMVTAVAVGTQPTPPAPEAADTEAGKARVSLAAAAVSIATGAEAAQGAAHGSDPAPASGSLLRPSSAAGIQDPHPYKYPRCSAQILAPELPPLLPQRP